MQYSLAPSPKGMVAHTKAVKDAPRCIQVGGTGPRVVLVVLVAVRVYASYRGDHKDTKVYDSEDE